MKEMNTQAKQREACGITQLTYISLKERDIQRSRSGWSEQFKVFWTSEGVSKFPKTCTG